MYENPDQYPGCFAVFHFNGIGVTRFFCSGYFAGAGCCMRYPDSLNGLNLVARNIRLRPDF